MQIDLKEKQEAIISGLGSIALGGETYFVKKASPADFIAMRGRIRQLLPKPTEAFGEIARSPVWEFLDADERRAMAKDAAAKQMSGTPVVTEDQAWELIALPDHCRFWARLVLLGSHNPGLTKEHIHQMIDEDNSATVAWTLLEQAGGVTLGNASSSPSSSGKTA